MGIRLVRKRKLDTEGNEKDTPVETVNCPRLLRTEPETVDIF